MSKDLPQAVKNLRKIWDSKKIELRFTQTEAAKELGWSQGAISHYLNNITELRAPAIVKLANFLDVDPRDIDPDIENSLPSVEKKIVAYDVTDVSKRIDQVLISRRDESTILMRIPNGDAYTEHFSPLEPYTECYVKLISPSELKDPKMYGVRLKGRKDLQFYSKDTMPPSSKIHTLWSVVAFYYY